MRGSGSHVIVAEDPYAEARRAQVGRQSGDGKVTGTAARLLYENSIVTLTHTGKVSQSNGGEGGKSGPLSVSHREANQQE